MFFFSKFFFKYFKTKHVVLGPSCGVAEGITKK